jgi:hypothetical protein
VSCFPCCTCISTLQTPAHPLADHLLRAAKLSRELRVLAFVQHPNTDRGLLVGRKALQQVERLSAEAGQLLHSLEVLILEGQDGQRESRDLRSCSPGPRRLLDQPQVGCGAARVHFTVHVKGVEVCHAGDVVADQARLFRPHRALQGKHLVSGELDPFLDQAALTEPDLPG